MISNSFVSAQPLPSAPKVAAQQAEREQAYQTSLRTQRMAMGLGPYSQALALASQQGGRAIRAFPLTATAAAVAATPPADTPSPGTAAAAAAARPVPLSASGPNAV